MFDDTLHFLANHLEAPDWARLGEHLPFEWIEQALASTDALSIRHRRLPAEQVVWLMVALALYRHKSIGEVLDDLGHGVRCDELDVDDEPEVVDEERHRGRGGRDDKEGPVFNPERAALVVDCDTVARWGTCRRRREAVPGHDELRWIRDCGLEDEVESVLLSG